jgi:NADH-quinone oxidoreductase subunit N
MSFATLADVILVSPLILLLLGSMTPIALKVLLGNKEPNSLVVMGQGLGSILAAVILLITVYGLGLSRENPFIFSGMLVIDGISMVSGFTLLTMGALCLILMRDNPHTQGRGYAELIFLTLNSMLGMLVLVQAADLLTVFVGLEVMSLPLYVMIGMGHDAQQSKESAIKYFILGSFASAIFLMGLSFIYGTAATTSLVSLSQLGPQFIVESRLFSVGLIFIITGFLFKISLFPFHAWTADVYQGAPTPHTTFMATAVKVASVAAMLRFIVIGYFGVSESLLNAVQWLAALTMLVGNAGALLQTHVKRMLAYSSVAHSGYVVLGLLVAGLGSDLASKGSSAVLFYLFSYSLMVFGALSFVSYLEKKEGSILKIEDLAGLATQKPGLALAMTVLLLSLAGIPPTLGFFGKFYLFTEALSQGFVWLTVWAALSSVVGVYYYLRPIVMMYMVQGQEPGLLVDHPGHRILTRAGVILMALLILGLGLCNSTVLEIISSRL